MSLSTKKAGIIVVIIAVIVGASYGFTYYPDTESVGLSGTVTIGSIMPITGDLSILGAENVEITKLAVNDFNNYLNENNASWNLEVIQQDSQTNPTIALEKLKMFDSMDVKIIAGPQNSSNVNGVKDYAAENDILLVTCCSTAASLAIPGDGIYRLVPDDSKQGMILAEIMQSQEIEVIVPLWRNDTWGNGLEGLTRSAFAQNGGIVDDGIRYERDTVDFTTQMTQLANTIEQYNASHGADKVAIVYLGFDEVLQIMQSAAEHESLGNTKWFSAWAITKDIQIISDSRALEFATKVKFTGIQAANANNQTSDRVQNHIEQTLNRDASGFTYAAYDVIQVLGLAIQETQGVDPEQIKKVLPKIAGEYTGAMGRTVLNDAGDLMQGDYELWRVYDGTWVQTGIYNHNDGSVTIFPDFM